MKMKKYMVLILVCFSIVSFMACKNDAIFAEIEEEVNLKKFSVEATIIGFAEIEDDIYVANSQALFSKNKNALSTAPWEKIEHPTEANLISSLAVKEDSIFAIFIEGGPYFFKEGQWNKIENTYNIESCYGDSVIFGGERDESDEKNKQKRTVYEITETGVTALGTFDSEYEYLVGASGDYYASSGIDDRDSKNKKYVGKIYSKTDTKPVPALAELEGIKTLCAGPNNTVFIVADEKIYQFDGTNLNSKDISKEKPLSLFYFKERNALLIGCKEGYTELKFTDDDINNASEILPGKEGSTTPKDVYSQFTSAIGKSLFRPIFAVEASDASSYSVFAGITPNVSLKNKGLWAYHSNGKPEWNRE